MSAIFISHSSRDAAAAEEVLARLHEHGHRSVFLDFDPENGIPAGRDWEQELYRRLRACQAMIVPRILGPAHSQDLRGRPPGLPRLRRYDARELA